MRKLLVTLLLLPAFAQAEPFSEESPFAEAHVLLQVSAAEAARHALVLDIANNLTKHYGGQDMVDIQIVAFGPGVQLLFAENNPLKARIESLMAYGVRFFVCGNTLDTIERRDKERPVVIAGVSTVQTGVAYMLEQVQAGYVHVHP